MDILIKNMALPKNCGCCPLAVGGRFTFTCMRMIGKEFSYELAEQRQEDCPLVELPPHGRLGDLDLVEEWMRKKHKDNDCPFDIDAFLFALRKIPTVLEATEGGRMNV